MNLNGWSLEVVRGREAGKLYPLKRGETVLGNALNGSAGLDLAHQEGDGPRRMAARQAQLDCSGPGLTLRDLDSPGGTFVNRQRLLPGQNRTLQPGDLIQIGSVQLKVVEAAPSPSSAREPAPRQAATPAAQPAPRKAATAPPPQAAPASASPAARAPAPAPAPAASATARPGPLSRPFALASGASCRTWDDFLTISAQRWVALREELTSGRLAGFLVSSGHASLAPSAAEAGSPDERLDSWLGSLPATRPCQPELDVHPAKLTVRAVAGGGLTRQVLRITNTGYRLLRSTVRVDPAAASWIRVLPEFTAPFVTVESTEVVLEVRIPEALGAPLTGHVVVEGNGGTRRVAVVIERLPPPESIPEVSSALYGVGGPDLYEWVVRQSVARRLLGAIGGGVGLRLLVALGDLLPIGSGSADVLPRLSGAAIVFAAIGGLLAAALSARRWEARDVPAAGFAGGFSGVLLAAVTVASCRALEPSLGPSLWVTVPLWAALGAGLAGLSVLVVPPAHAAETAP